MASLKRWLRVIGVILLITLIEFGWPQWMFSGHSDALAAINQVCVNEQQIDLNNANIILFQDCPGFYPQLAKTIINHAPYSRVKDVLKISELTSQQRALLKKNLKHFTVSDPISDVGLRMPPRPALRANP